MISILKAKTPAKSKNGDILRGGEFISHIYPDTRPVIAAPLGILNRDHWVALEKLMIDFNELVQASRYECLVRGITFYSVYPIGISEYKTGELPKFLDHMYGVDHPVAAGKISRSFLGHGYTDYLEDDGDNGLHYGRVDLDDGRYLIVAFFEWYNK